ncbi:MAG: hypothetical protein ABEJ06_06265 [Haloarculaceae archaeon]
MSLDEEHASAEAVARRVVLSYPADLGSWGAGRLDTRSFRRWLVRTRDRAEVGDVWEEFVDGGCCGSTVDADLRVETVEGGPEVTADTAFEFVERE